MVPVSVCGSDRVSVAGWFGSGVVPVSVPEPVSESEPISEPEPRPNGNRSVPEPDDLGTVADQARDTADGASATIEPPGSAST